MTRTTAMETANAAVTRVRIASRRS
jgi:hypothetical protein